MSPKPKKYPKTTNPSFKPRKIRIKIVGLGGGGSSIVSEMAQTLKAVTFLIADTDIRVFKKARKGVKVFQFGEKLAGGMGTGVDPDLAKRAALAEKDKIGAKIFKGQDLVILIGSLGGGVASGAGPVFAEISTSRNLDVSKSQHFKGSPVTIGIFTLPFAFEGEKKLRLAKKALSNLQENLSGIIVVPNEKIFQLIDKKTPLKKALSTLNQAFTDWLQDLINLILKPSLINIDFADLRTILKEHGKFLFFGRGLAQGPNRGEEALKKLFQNPLASSFPNHSKHFNNPKRILFNITGGKDLKLKEVESISQAVAELNPRAKIIFGITENPQYKGKIKITLLAVNNGEKPSPPQPLKTPKKPLKKSKLPTRHSERQRRISKTRRTALEVKKADEEQKEREWAQEPEWQIPTFLRKKIK